MRLFHFFFHATGDLVRYRFAVGGSLSISGAFFGSHSHCVPFGLSIWTINAIDVHSQECYGKHRTSENHCPEDDVDNDEPLHHWMLRRNGRWSM